MGRAFGHGWITLPSDGELYLEHGVPRLVRMTGDRTADVERIAGEVEDVAGVHVTLGRWSADEDAGEIEAVVHVAADDVSEIMKRLAHASAEMFHDRYHKRMDANDVDFDDEAYAQDFNFAMEVCGLRWDQVDERPLRHAYLQTLREEIDELARESRD